jgi:gas vesicle protein
MNTRAETAASNTFLIGLIAGGVIGVGLALAFAPRAGAELRRRVRATAQDWTNAASQGYDDASARIHGAVDGVTARGQAIRDDVANAVGRGAREVEDFAMAAKTSGRS